MGDGEYSSQSADQGGENVQVKEKLPHVDVHTGKPHRVQIKVTIPVKDHPNFNFVGKLLGPKGSSLKQMQEVTQTRMAILGRGSMRDKKKEEELRAAGEAKYAHLNEELHVEVSAYAPPAEAYRRIAHAIDELSRFLIPDNYQEMSMNGARGPKPPVPPPGYGYEEPAGPPRPPPPVPAPPPARGGAGYWASTPPARGGAAAARRVLQPRPAPGTGRRPPAPGGGPGPDYSYDDPYGRYDAGGASTDYYADQGMEEAENFAADDYSAEPRPAGGGPTRSFPRAARPHPYGASSRPF